MVRATQWDVIRLWIPCSRLVRLHDGAVRGYGGGILQPSQFGEFDINRRDIGEEIKGLYK